MSALIFRLRQVPDDEAQAIRELLDQHAIDWYETSAGNWGISMPGFWVNRDDQAARARQLIDHYQHERSTIQRKIHQQRKEQGQVETLTHRLMQHPVRLIGIVLFCLFILYVSIHPFMQMIEFSKQ